MKPQIHIEAAPADIHAGEGQALREAGPIVAAQLPGGVSASIITHNAVAREAMTSPNVSKNIKDWGEHREALSRTGRCPTSSKRRTW